MQSALDALKRDGFGILYCPQGNYGMMKQFPEYCNFPDGCIFGANTIFGEGCSFGEWTSFGKHCHFGAECTFGVSCAFNEGCVFDEWCHFSEKNRFVGAATSARTASLNMAAQPACSLSCCRQSRNRRKSRSRICFSLAIKYALTTTGTCRRNCKA